MKKLFLPVALLRFRLLLRQKLGWLTVLVGLGLVLLSVFVAQVSFISPLKIFWDFSLAVSFLLQVGLALYLSTQLFGDESSRRTLHLVLSCGLSRSDWLIGNGLGLWLTLLAMNLVWFLFSCATAWLVFGSSNFLISFQAQWLVGIESGIVLFLGLFLSLWVRPLMALAGATAVVLFSHSLESLQRVFTDPQVGRFVEDRGVSVVIWFSKLFPPLEWFNVRSMVGYEALVPWGTVAALSAVGLLWILLLAVAASLRFERMDL